MLNLEITGGHLLKPFDANCKDIYIQCVADFGVDHISITPLTDISTKIIASGKEIKSGEPIKIKLREDGYGYVTTSFEIKSFDNSFEKSFTLAVLKPAPNYETLYSLENRPQFHYTAPYGYINDPNGMIYNAHSKEYHLFYQAYPYTQKGGPKHWGHAVTKDLVTFKEYDTALYPDDSGSMWSGTAIIDYNNTAKLYDKNTPPEARMILVYYAWKEGETSAGLAYTPDGGKTWKKAENGRKFNFIGAHPGHIDPKVFWFDQAKKWTMFCASGEIFTSENLWDWELHGKDQHSECPDIYKISLKNSDKTKYLHTYGGTDYRVGDLRENPDGTIDFVPETDFIPYSGDSLNRRDQKVESILQQKGWFSGKTGTLYATQHYTAAPDNRTISVSWLIEKGLDLSETWAGAMTVATEQTLKQRKDGYILYNYPVKELDSLHDELVFSGENIVITPNSKNILTNVFATYADIDGSFVLAENVTEIGFRLRKGFDNGDINIKYNVINELLVADYSNSRHSAYNGIRTMSMKMPEDRTISMRILLDSIIVESFGNCGEAYIGSVFCRENLADGMEFYTVNGNTKIEKLNIYTMKSIWKNK